jgi:4'-phosphopantetheinyl transferase
VDLASDELHVWEASLARSAAQTALLRDLLSPDERDRADRFRFDRDRDRYTAARGMLRILLGAYLGRPPASLTFDYGRFQKPALRGGGLSFNLSHSGPVALYAICAGGEVGIDIERDDADFARERIAEHFFSTSEVQALRSVPQALQARAFLHCWTRKEAFIKARGDGLSLALDSFDVSLKPGYPALLLRTAWSEVEPGRWTVRDLSDPERGYIGALAIRSKGWRLIHRRVPDELDGETAITLEGT